MKKTVIPAWIWRLSLIVLLLGGIFMVNSCRKANKWTAQDAEMAKALTDLPLTEAMEWFGRSKSTLTAKVKTNADAAFLSTLADFTPVWDSARTAVDTNYYVVEAPAKYVKKLGFDTESGTAANVNGATRLLVLKSKVYGSLSAVLMHIHAEAGINAGTAHYMAIPQNFSGMIFYTSLQGVFINGYIYKNGKVIKVSSGTANTVKPTGPKILLEANPGDGCETVITNYFTRTCNYNAAGALLGCSEWVYLFSTINVYCDPNNMPSGGGVAPPPPCPPDTGNDGGGGSGDGPGDSLFVASFKGKLVIRLVSGDSTGTGGSSVSNTLPCVPMKILDSIDKKYKCAKAILALLPNLRADLSKLINTTFNTTGSKDISFKDAPAQALKDPTEDGESSGYSISLNQDVLANASGEYILATMYHEALHSFLYSEFLTLGEAAFNAKYPEVLVKSTPYINISGMLKYKFTFDEGNQVSTVASDPQHRTMAEYFVNKITDGILAYNPSFPPERARALARYGIIIDTTILAMNNAERDKRKGESVGIQCP